MRQEITSGEHSKRAVWLVFLLAAACTGPKDSVPVDVGAEALEEISALDIQSDGLSEVGVDERDDAEPGPAEVVWEDTVDAATGDLGSDAGSLVELVAVPAGTFVMGDHSGQGGEDPKHPSDEVPLHSVTVGAFEIGRYEVTCGQYVEFLNDAASAGAAIVEGGAVRGTGGPAVWIETSQKDPASRVSWDGTAFAAPDDRLEHPITGVRWEGAAAFTNWLSKRAGLPACTDVAAGTVDYAVSCYRLPTEAEWEYAALGGRKDPYPIYPWGDELDPSRANWPGSGDPYEVGPDPKTTPVGFYDGSVREREGLGWPGEQTSYPTHDGANDWGLYDMAGNVWEWTNDWYRKDYYAVSPLVDPPGPSLAEASPMPDGKPYRCMRGGNWFNGTTPDKLDGHSRVSNRDPSYFRGPGDPNGPWFHVGFRVVLAHPQGGAR